VFGQLLRKGYSLLFDDGECTVYDKKHKLTVAKVGMSRNNVFPLSMPSNERISLKCEHVDDSHLWHLRYGHLNYQGLQLLKKRNMVVGLPSIQNNDRICEGCIYGKMHRLPFPKTAWRARAPLELVHADICGPTRTPSLNNKRYFLLFVDDYTRMMWIYFLDQKSEAFTFFLQFKALVERQSGYQMKTLRTDRGGEFIYKPFLHIVKKMAFKGSSQFEELLSRMVLPERKNRTIEEMARSMLKGKGLPNMLWAEAVHTAVYILNCSPTKAV
jgi:transposase InsO family protein